MLGAVRPTGGRRSWWLREALAGEPAELAAAAPAARREHDRGRRGPRWRHPALALPLVGVLPRAFPPEPLRYVGARVVREAIVRTELAEERGERGSRLLREVSRLPRRLGYHLGPE